MYKIYHNPRCSKSRAGLKYLEDKGFAFEIVKYLEDPISSEELKEVFAKIGKTPFEMVRTQEEEYKLNFRGKNFTDDEWYDILVKYPKLLKRPIIVHNQKAIWAVPAEVIESI